MFHYQVCDAFHESSKGLPTETSVYFLKPAAERAYNLKYSEIIWVFSEMF